MCRGIEVKKKAQVQSVKFKGLGLRWWRKLVLGFVGGAVSSAVTLGVRLGGSGILSRIPSLGQTSSPPSAQHKHSLVHVRVPSFCCYIGNFTFLQCLFQVLYVCRFPLSFKRLFVCCASLFCLHAVVLYRKLVATYSDSTNAKTSDDTTKLQLMSIYYSYVFAQSSRAGQNIRVVNALIFL
jgi:hypothetical protein